MKNETELNRTELANILGCPFCGNLPKYINEDDTLINFHFNSHSDLVDSPEDIAEEDELEVSGYSVYCERCKIKGPEKLRREEAITVWNERSPSVLSPNHPASF